MVVPRDAKPERPAQRASRRIAQAAPAEYQEAVNAAAYDHQCPRCGALPDDPCTSMRHPGRINAHPHYDRQNRVEALDIDPYLGG